MFRVLSLHSLVSVLLLVKLLLYTLHVKFVSIVFFFSRGKIKGKSGPRQLLPLSFVYFN